MGGEISVYDSVLSPGLGVSAAGFISRLRTVVVNLIQYILLKDPEVHTWIEAATSENHRLLHRNHVMYVHTHTHAHKHSERSTALSLSR